MVNTTPKKSRTTHLWMCLFVHHSFLQTLHSPHVSPSAIERTPVSRNAGRDQAHDAESQTGNGADCNLALEWSFGWGIFTCLPKMCWKCVWYSQTQWTLQRFWFVFFAGFWSHVVLPCFDHTFCSSHSSRFYSNIVRSIWRSTLQNLVVSKGWSLGSLWMPWRLWNMSLGLGPSLKEMDLLQ